MLTLRLTQHAKDQPDQLQRPGGTDRRGPGSPDGHRPLRLRAQRPGPGGPALVPGRLPAVPPGPRPDDRRARRGADAPRSATSSSGPCSRPTTTPATCGPRCAPACNETRVEIITGVQEAAAIPWELIRDPKTDGPWPCAPRCLCARPAAGRAARRTPRGRGRRPIRILLVICRPGGGDDVPFRSVARRLLEGLTEETRQTSSSTCCARPPLPGWPRCCAQAKADGQALPRRPLRRARRVHRDAEQPGRLAESLQRLSTWCSTAPRAGTHGYLLFENPERGREHASWSTARRWASCWPRPACRCWCSTPAARPTRKRPLQPAPPTAEAGPSGWPTSTPRSAPSARWPRR